jgi:hypothetical protein
VCERGQVTRLNKAFKLGEGAGFRATTIGKEGTARRRTVPWVTTSKQPSGADMQIYKEVASPPPSGPPAVSRRPLPAVNLDLSPGPSGPASRPNPAARAHPVAHAGRGARARRGAVERAGRNSRPRRALCRRRADARAPARGLWQARAPPRPAPWARTFFSRRFKTIFGVTEGESVRLLSPSLNATLPRRAQVRVRAGAVHPQPRPGASAPGQPAPRGPARNATRASPGSATRPAGQMRQLVKCDLTRARRAACRSRRRRRSACGLRGRSISCTPRSAPRGRPPRR